MTKNRFRQINKDEKVGHKAFFGWRKPTQSEKDGVLLIEPGVQTYILLFIREMHDKIGYRCEFYFHPMSRRSCQAYYARFKIKESDFDEALRQARIKSLAIARDVLQKEIDRFTKIWGDIIDNMDALMEDIPKGSR